MHSEGPVHEPKREARFGEEVRAPLSPLSSSHRLIGKLTFRFHRTRPLNPVLGELFFGYWPDKDGRGKTDLAVEQVSHHPPITAYYIENKTKGISLEGASGQKTSFSFPSIIGLSLPLMRVAARFVWKEMLTPTFSLALWIPYSQAERTCYAFHQASLGRGGEVSHHSS